MGQSLVQNYVHLVFSTKYRQPLILPPYENELYQYIGGICNYLECLPISIGGYLDHVHILCKRSTKIALMKLMEEIKANSSKWMKTKDELYKNFYWQTGNGAFSVNYKNIDKLVAYISNQHEHHKQMNFQQEYSSILKHYNIPFDERYVWD